MTIIIILYVPIDKYSFYYVLIFIFSYKRYYFRDEKCIKKYRVITKTKKKQQQILDIIAKRNNDEV